MRTERINFLDLNFDLLNFKDVKERLEATTSETPYAYVVTPNVDHVVRAHREPRLRELYEEADLCVCDSRILKLLARLSGTKLPLVPGSDLTAALFRHVIRPGDRIAIVGADCACLERLREQYPGVDFAHFEAPMGLREHQEARRAAAEFVAKAKPRFALIAVGSPQQEMIANEIRRVPGATGVGLCIGAGLDFIVGRQKRAPNWVQALGLEWAHRLATNPRRLWRRYLVEGVRIFPIWLRWRGSSRQRFIVFGLLTASAVALLGLAYLGARSLRANGGSETVELPPATARSIAAIRALPPPNLVKPVSPEEAAKENAERPFILRPDTPASRFVLRADGEDRDRALTCLAQAVYYEAAGEGVDGGRAVAQVVLNRLHHPGFPSTVCGVVYEGSDRPTGCQFSFTCDGSMQRIPVPSLWTRSKEIAEQALKGKVYAPVGHATHYHADYVLPYWADSLDKSVQIGRHIFYRLKGTIGDAAGFSQHYGGTEPPFREPGATIALPPTPENQQLANTLMGAPAGQVANDPLKASSPPNAPLLADSSRGTLLADGAGDAQPAERREKKKPSGCAASKEPKAGSTLRADEVHALPGADPC